MKLLFIFFAFIALKANTQTVGFQNGRFTININTATTNIKPGMVNDMEIYDVRTGNIEGQGNLLMSYVNRTFFYFNATPAASDITQIGTSGAWNIILPTTPTINKSLFIPDKSIVIAYSSLKYGFVLSNNFFPVDIRLLVNGNATGNLVCRVFSDGNIYWPDVSVRTPTAIASNTLTQYFIN